MLRRSIRKVSQECGEGVLPRSDEDRVRVWCCFIRQRRNVEAAERDVGAARTIVVGDSVRAIGVGDVDLNDHQVGSIVEIERLDVLILQSDFEVGIEVRGESRQAQGRKERVLDRPPIGTRRLRQRREDEFYASQWRSHSYKLLYIVK